MAIENVSDGDDDVNPHSNRPPFNAAVHAVLTALGFNNNTGIDAPEAWWNAGPDYTGPGHWDKYNGPSGEEVFVFASGDLIITGTGNMTILKKRAIWR